MAFTLPNRLRLRPGFQFSWSATNKRSAMAARWADSDVAHKQTNKPTTIPLGNDCNLRFITSTYTLLELHRACRTSCKQLIPGCGLGSRLGAGAGAALSPCLRQAWRDRTNTCITLTMIIIPCDRAALFISLYYESWPSVAMTTWKVFVCKA